MGTNVVFFVYCAANASVSDVVGTVSACLSVPGLEAYVDRSLPFGPALENRPFDPRLVATCALRASVSEGLVGPIVAALAIRRREAGQFRSSGSSASIELGRLRRILAIEPLVHVELLLKVSAIKCTRHQICLAQ